MKRLLCKLLGHKQFGPIAIGEPGDIRYYCTRCNMMTTFNVKSNEVRTLYYQDAVEEVKKCHRT